MMLPVTHMLVFSAWLAAQSGATKSAPKVSIFLRPPGVIPLGGSTTICCRCLCPGGSVVLYKNGLQLRTLVLRDSMAEFYISNATHTDNGRYSCSYAIGSNGTVLTSSEILDVLVEEIHLPKPALSVLPGHEVATGADVIFRCTIKHSKVVCFLYLEGQASAVNSSVEHTDLYLSRVNQSNGGHYSCQCYTSGAPINWSEVSDMQELVVRESLLPGPSISVTPREGAILGTPATIRCRCQCHGTVMLLYKSGTISIQQRAQPVGGIATFNITQVAQEDGGIYACRYGNESDVSSLSQLSPLAELLVRGENTKHSHDTMLGLETYRHIKSCPQSLSGLKHFDFVPGAPPAAWSSAPGQLGVGRGRESGCRCPVPLQVPHLSLLTDDKLAKPSLFLKPQGRVRPGTNVTLCCSSRVQRAQFYFWRNWELVGVIKQESNEATFVLPHVMGHHGGTYTCTYRPWSQSYVSSQASSSIWLAVADYTRSNMVRLAMGAGVLVLLGLIVAEAMHSHRHTPGQLGPT